MAAAAAMVAVSSALAAAVYVVDGREAPRNAADPAVGEDAVARGVAFLVSEQQDDGSWRSERYRSLDDPFSLSGPITKVLCFAAPDSRAALARDRAVRRLVEAVDGEGRIDFDALGVKYPVHAAAMAVAILSRTTVEGGIEARAAWERALRTLQYTEASGWQVDDAAYGGWGYWLRRADEVESRTTGEFADISSTLFAVGALRMAGAGAEDEAIRRALRFAEHCQNFTDGGDGKSGGEKAGDEKAWDGGFFFSPTSVTGNKAGMEADAVDGQLRFRSYGSATADGLRLLLRCGVARDDPRVAAAIAWLARNFSVRENPGRFTPAREVDRASSYYYYAWSVAHALRLANVVRLRGATGDIDWAAGLSAEVIARQETDGAWSNPYGAMMEDDPLVATPLACGAVAICRLAIGAAGGRPAAEISHYAPQEKVERKGVEPSTSALRTQRSPN